MDAKVRHLAIEAREDVPFRLAVTPYVRPYEPLEWHNVAALVARASEAPASLAELSLTLEDQYLRMDNSEQVVFDYLSNLGAMR